MEMNLLIDTNILVYLSKKEITFADFAKKNDRLFISVITVMEVKGYRFKSDREERFIEQLCHELMTIYIDEQIVNKVIEIKKKRKIKLPDAIILATAITKKQALVTRNTKDFINFTPSLSIINPFYRSEQ